MLDKQQLKQLELINYLVGEASSSTHSMIKTGDKCYPTKSSLLKVYLNEVYRFLFAGGINVDVEDAEENDPRQEFIKDFISYNKLQLQLQSIWETGSTTGELLCVPYPYPTKQRYILEYFDKTEFEPTYEAGDITKIEVFAKRNIEGESHYYKLEIDSEFYYTYPLVKAKDVINFDWKKVLTKVPHEYNQVPAVVIKNKFDIKSKRGKTDFDLTALKIACAHLIGTFDADENLHFFGSPLFAAADPKTVLALMKKRIQVLPKEAPEDGGAPESISFNALSPEHLKIIEQHEKTFKQHMGIKSEEQQSSGDMSSLSLRIVNAASINTATTKWQNYVEDGLISLFQLAVSMAQIDRVILGSQDTEITVVRKVDYFPPSVQETNLLLGVAEKLVYLGMDRSEALQMTYLKTYTKEQIDDMLAPYTESMAITDSIPLSKHLGV